MFSDVTSDVNKPFLGVHNITFLELHIATFPGTFTKLYENLVTT